MAERHDVLDQAVQAILDGATEVAIPRDLEPLVAIAADLRDLPNPEFKRRLGGRMTATATSVEIREVTPYLVVEDADTLIHFAKNVFGAKETLSTKGGAGGTHCELHIGDSKLMMGAVAVDDADAAFGRAGAAGAKVLDPPSKQAYGRRGAVEDPFGNQWHFMSEK